MNKNKHIPRLGSILLSLLMVFSGTFSAYATDVIISESQYEKTETDGDGAVPEGENNPDADNNSEIFLINNDIDNQNDEEPRYEEIEVTYSQSSNYMVTIPKTIMLGEDKRASYPIKVEGDIAANKQVCVVPVDGIKETEVFDFYMSDQIAGTTKKDVVAEIDQAKFYWSYEDVENGYEETDNHVVADGLSAGRWKGTFQMEISMRTDPAHIHNYVGEITKPPTCTEAGEKTYTCDCGESYTEIMDPTSHHYVDGECADCGEKDPNDHKHSYTEEVTKEPTCTDAGEKTLTCNCGDTKTESIPAIGHHFEDGECTGCGEKDPDYHKHSYTEKVTKEPTCTEAGEKVYTCACGNSYTEESAAIGHDFESGFCTNCGMADGSVIQVTENNTYIAKSRGLDFEIIVPDAESTSCSVAENDHITLEGNVVSVNEDAAIGSVVPVTVTGDDKTYTANIIVAPDVSDNSYEIYNSNDLKTLSIITNNGAINDVNQNARLMNDIDLSDVCSADLGNWTRIGWNNNPYVGVFDGQGYTIDNIYINYQFTTVLSAAQYYGLFGVTNGATIKNTTLNGQISVATSKSTQKSSFCIGGFVGCSGSTTTFENLINNCNVSSRYTASTTISMPFYAGGISGYGGGIFTNCKNNGNIYAQHDAGGISGYSGNFVNCTNSGTVKSYVQNAGGISGENGSTFVYCNNSGSVSGKCDVGGIAGLPYTGAKYNYCYNTGSVNGNNAGGICGNGASNIITDCYNTGQVSGSNSSGGITGMNANQITNCYNRGYISSAYFPGGIIGEATSTNVYVRNCYNIGTVYGSNATSSRPGGIGGGSMNENNQLINCAVSKNTKIYITGKSNATSYQGSTSNYAGIFKGYNVNVTLTDCVHLEDETLKTYAETLGESYTNDTSNINDGYPILKFQEE